MPINRPSSYGNSGLTRNRVATQARQDEALRLRRAGHSYIDIATQLGFTPNGVPRPQSAHEACRVAIRREEERLRSGVVETTSGSLIPSNRTFGFEAEFFNITPMKAVEALRAVGIDVQWARYTHDVTTHWKIVTDASVTGRGTGVGTGLELVSPILRGVAGLELASKALKALFEAGARVNKTCGIHVHVGMDGLNGDKLIKVIDLYTANQGAIDTILASSRHSNSYCYKYQGMNIQGQDIVRLLSALKDADTEEKTRIVRSQTATAPRYRVINLVAYSKYGTFEFRQHQGTLNGEKLTSWIIFILALIEKAVALDDASVDFGSLDALLANIDVSDEVTGFLKTRAERLASTSTN
jgi:hypothetical protein